MHTVSERASGFSVLVLASLLARERKGVGSSDAGMSLSHEEHDGHAWMGHADGTRTRWDLDEVDGYTIIIDS